MNCMKVPGALSKDRPTCWLPVNPVSTSIS